MNLAQTPAGYALLGALLLFLVFLVVKSRLPLIRGMTDEQRAAKAKIAEAKLAARAAGNDPAARAAAFRKAAAVALEELGRPGLAASFALRAERADPGDGRAVGVLSVALRRQARFGALEKMLWRRLSADPGPAFERAFTELLALYDGPMRKPERAAALRRLRTGASERTTG